MKSTDQNILITVDEALTTILEKISPVSTESIPLTSAFNRILAEPIVSQVNVPPFANSAMDGYAVITADTAGASEEGPIVLKVIDNIPAGAASSIQLSPGNAARIMTGAPVPGGTGAIVRFEDTSEHRSTPDGVGIGR